MTLQARRLWLSIALVMTGCVGTVGDAGPWGGTPGGVLEVTGREAIGRAVLAVPFDEEPELRQIIVRYKAGPLGLENAAERTDLETAERLYLRRELSGLNAVVYEVEVDDTVSEVVERVKANHAEKILSVEMDTIAMPAGTTNDPLLSSEWHLGKIGALTAWDTTRGENVTVADLDTGVNCGHADLAGNCVPGWNTANQNSDTTDLNGHGTATSGTVASVGDNATGGAGVAHKSKLMPVRIAFDSTGSTSCSAIADGILYAANHGAKVASNSYWVAGCSVATDAANYMASKGGLYVRAMGNDATLINTPNDSNIIHVGATDSSDVKTSWSNYGPQIDVAAPGTPIYCTTVSGGYGNCWGTSFSVPIVSGVLALMYSANPELTAEQAKSILFTTAQDLGATGWDQEYGHGRVDAARAVALALSTVGGNVQDTIAPSTPANLTASNVTSSQATLSWSASVDNVLVTQYAIYRDGARVGTTSGTSFVATGLAAETSYRFTVAARDAAGNESAQSNGVTVATPPTPFAVSQTSVSTKTSTTATIAVTTTRPATVTVRYGFSASALTSSAQGGSTLATSQSVGLSGLKPKSRYYYQVIATGETGQTAASAVYNFRTR